MILVLFCDNCMRARRLKKNIKKIKPKKKPKKGTKTDGIFTVFVDFKNISLFIFWFCMCYLSGERKAVRRKRFWWAEPLCQPNSL